MNKHFNIGICDDEKAALSIISSAVRGAFEDKNFQVTINEFTDPRKMIAHMRQEPLNLLFLDIEMPGCDGINSAAALRESGVETDIVFVTNCEERVFETFRVKPFGFVRKNKFLTDLAQIVNLYILTKAGEKENMPRLVITTGGKTFNIETDKIKYVECLQRKQKIIFNDGRDELLVGNTMENIENYLRDCGFYRVHKGFIVNLRNVRLISADGVILDDNTRIPINRKKLQQFKHDYLLFQQHNGSRILPQ